MGNLFAADPTGQANVEQTLVQRLVMVDDNPTTLQGFADLVHRTHADRWKVTILDNGDKLLHLLESDFPNLPHMVSIDLGLPPDPKSPRYGLELLEQVHQNYCGLTTIVHSFITPIPEWASQFILSIPVSYISTASESDIQAYAQMLPWLAKGFKIYSPLVGETLSRVVLQHPDPLYDDEWRIVELIAKGLKGYQIAQEVNYAETTVAEKISRIAQRLNALGHIDVNVEDRRPLPHRYRDALSQFYKDNAVRYRRLRRS